MFSKESLSSKEYSRSCLFDEDSTNEQKRNFLRSVRTQLYSSLESLSVDGVDSHMTADQD